MKKLPLVLAMKALALVAADPSFERQRQRPPREDWRIKALRGSSAIFEATMRAENADLELRVKVLEQKMAALLSGKSHEKVREIHADRAATEKVQKLREAVEAAKVSDDSILKDFEIKRRAEEKKAKEGSEGKSPVPESK